MVMMVMVMVVVVMVVVVVMEIMMTMIEENYFLKDEIEGKTNACHSITPTSTLERLYEVVLELIFEESF